MVLKKLQNQAEQSYTLYGDESDKKSYVLGYSIAMVDATEKMSELVEKNTAREVYCIEGQLYGCPSCKRVLVAEKYCPSCGQKIEWRKIK